MTSFVVWEQLGREGIAPKIHEIIIENQHGFMPKRSTLSNLVSFNEFLIDVLENKGQVDVPYLDFSKAFDKVNHNLLISKLQAIGVQDPLLSWFRSFLTNRTQKVRVANNIESSPIFVSSGCIQGGHASGLVFLIFILQNLPELTESINYWLFADDLKVPARLREREDALRLQRILSLIHDWCQLNMMELNINKCVVVTYHRNQNPLIFNYQLDNHNIKRTDNILDLGITFRNDLKF